MLTKFADGSGLMSCVDCNCCYIFQGENEINFIVWCFFYPSIGFFCPLRTKLISDFPCFCYYKMLLRSGYNTDYKYGRENWKPSDYHNFMESWGKNEFKNEVSRMRQRLEKIGIQYNGWR